MLTIVISFHLFSHGAKTFLIALYYIVNQVETQCRMSWATRALKSRVRIPIGELM